jgi:hypothetical protein
MVNGAATAHLLDVDSFYLKLPDGYSSDDETHYVYRIKNDKSEEVREPLPGPPVLKFWAQRKGVNNSGQFALNFTALLDGVTPTEITLPYLRTSDTRSMLDTFNDQGLHIDPAQGAKWGNLVAAFTEQLHKLKLPTLPSERLGWSYNDTKPSAFVYARWRRGSTGNQPVASANNDSSRVDYPTGSLGEWQRAAKQLTDLNNPSLNALIASAFAAPLVKATGLSGAMVNAYSDTGTFKTSGSRIGQAVWAQPVVGGSGINDTANFLDGRLSTYVNLPVYCDDPRINLKSDALVGMMWSATGGKGKGRLNRSSQPQPVPEFSTLVIVTTNISLSEHVAQNTKMTEAGIIRLFEFPVTKTVVGPAAMSTAQETIGDLSQHYGRAGEIYADFLGHNAAQVFKEVRAANAQLAAKLGAVQEERYWVSTVTVLWMGARYASKLGLVEIDDGRLLAFLAAQFNRMRRERLSTDIGYTRPSKHLADYLNERKQQTLMTHELWTQPGKPPDAYNGGTIGGMLHLREPLVIRAAKETKLLRFSKRDFNRWAYERGVQARVLLKAVMEKMPARELKGTITAYSQRSGGAQEPLIEIDLAQAPEVFSFE